MLLNKAQQSALRLLEQASVADSQKNGVADEQLDADLNTLKTYTARENSIAPQAMIMGDISDYVDIKSLVTPSTRKQLETLRDYANLSDDGNQAQKEAVVQAYKSLSKDIKSRLVKSLIEKGIVTVVSSVPKLALFAIPISKLLASPLTDLAINLNDQCLNLQHRIINSALKILGRPEIDSESKDLFMAKLIGSFADQILSAVNSGKSQSFREIVANNRKTSGTELAV